MQIMTLKLEPIDPNILYDQNIYRLETVWDNQTTLEINYKRHEVVVYRIIPLHHSILSLLRA